MRMQDTYGPILKNGHDSKSKASKKQSLEEMVEPDETFDADEHTTNKAEYKSMSDAKSHSKEKDAKSRAKEAPESEASAE